MVAVDDETMTKIGREHSTLSHRASASSWMSCFSQNNLQYFNKIENAIGAEFINFDSTILLVLQTINMQLMKYISLFLLAAGSASAFAPVVVTSTTDNKVVEPARLSPLFMGRAAAVRAATKSKTDAKKAKTNAVFGKKIIMAVKQGGSPDPNSNRMLGDIIRQAKASSVPMDVSSVLKYCDCISLFFTH